MKVQVIDKDGKVIAWIDLQTLEMIHSDDYTFKIGDNLPPEITK